MATSDKLNKLLETKAAIKQAIINKGVDVGEDVIFADYPSKISAIQSGGNGPDYTSLYLAKTSNGTNYTRLFNSCTSIISLDLSSWDTSNVTNMEYMFYLCDSLTELNVSTWDTSNVTNMSSMFNFCSALESLDLSGWEINDITDTSNMLGYCMSLHTLRLDNCSNATINKIITSSGFTTGTISGTTRRMYVKEANVAGLTAPDGWVFEYVD